MSSLGVSTTVEQDDRHSSLIFRVTTRRILVGVTWQSRLTELLANEDGLTARGDLGGYKPGVLHLPWSRIRELHYAPARMGETGGLYAREGTFCSRCIAPRLTESQTTQLLATLVQRFPTLVRTVQFDLERGSHTAGHSCPAPLSSLDLLPHRPTPHARFLSHALSPVPRSATGRKHESARRLY